MMRTHQPKQQRGGKGDIDNNRLWGLQKTTVDVDLNLLLLGAEQGMDHPPGKKHHDHNKWHCKTHPFTKGDTVAAG